MGTISDKLTYLNTTKIMLRDSLNKFGSNILTTDTFRSYDTKLNDIYDKLPKITQSGAGFTIENVQNGQVDDFKIIGTDLYQNQLPSEYTAVEYLQSNGNQYIDTGINADSNLSLKFDFSSNYHIQQRHMGAIKNDNGTFTRHHVSLNATGSVWYIGSYSGITNIPNSLLTNVDDNKHYLDLDIYNKKISIDNQTPINLIFDSFDTNLNYWLFARNSNNETNISYVIMKLYYCKMYYKDKLVRDFAPCYRNSDNVAGLYDFVTKTFFTNQGTGTFTVGNNITLPNPDYPQDIKVVEGRQVITDSSKNLLKPHAIEDTNNGITVSYDEETRVYTFNGTCTQDNTTFMLSNVNINLTANVTKSITYWIGGSCNNYCYMRHYSSGYSLRCTYSISELNENNPKIVTTSQSTFLSPASLNTIRFNNGSVANNFKIKVMVTDDENTDFEPYYNPVGYNIDLNLENIYLAKIPNTNYKNKIYKNNGNWYFEENVKKVILDGNENWSVRDDSNIGYLFQLKVNDIVELPNSVTLGTIIANRLPTSTPSQLWTNNINGISNLNNGTYLRVRIQDSPYTTVNDFKNWLSTHNVIVYYALATPVTTQITNTTLIDQLEAISVHTGTNIITLSNDNNIIPEIEITRLKELERLT